MTRKPKARADLYQAIHSQETQDNRVYGSAPPRVHCSATGKVCHASKKIALAVRFAVYREGLVLSTDRMDIYKCDFCKSYHLGHSSHHDVGPTSQLATGCR